MRRSAKTHTTRLLTTASLFVCTLLLISGWQTTDAMQLTEQAEAMFVHHSMEPAITISSQAAFLMDVSDVPATAVTVRSQTTITDVNATKDLERVTLASLATSDSGETQALAVMWEPTGKSFFGAVWTLSLQSETGWVADSIRLSRTAPKAGHKYKTLLSYDGASGIVSVLVVSETEGRVIYQGEHIIQPSDAPLFPTAGVGRSWSSGQKPTHADFVGLAHVDSFAWAPIYLPVGARWNVGNISDSGTLLPVRRFASGEEIAVRLESEAVGGRFQLSSSAGYMAELASSAPDTLVPADDLGWGRLPLTLTYLGAADVPLLSETQEVIIGSVQAVVQSLEVDQPAQRLTGAVHVSTDGPPAVIQLNLTATITRTEWDPVARRYVAGETLTHPVLANSITVSGEESVIPIDVPFPGADPGLWQVSLEPSLTVAADVPVTIGNTSERLFTTYSAATNLQQRPFRFVVLPDTQNYPKAYPDILTRQAEWIAANANRLNIGAVLHMGDIVDDNVVTQWERARRSIGVLDGVVPYVLAVGNHDVRVIYTPQRSVFDREGALLNTYFSVENARAHSNLGGMFRDGQLENAYSLFSFGDEDLIVLSLEWGPRDEVLAWADAVLTEYPDHKAIIITHAFTAPDGGWVTPDRFPVALPPENDFIPNPSTVNSAADIWDQVIHHHDNVFMVLSGHMGMRAIPTNIRMGHLGHSVVEMMVNYQTEPNGGNGWLALITLMPDQRIHVEAFSPYLCEHRFDFDHNGFWHNFVIDTELGLSLPVTRDLKASCEF